MNKKYLNILLLILLLTIPVKAQYTFQDAFPNLPNFSFPVDLKNSGDCTNRLFVVEKEGIIKVLENRTDVAEIKTFLDINDRVFVNDIEMGLLGLTFHPEYSSNGYFYVNYTAGNPQRSVVSRFQVSNVNPDSADNNSEQVIISYLQPFHNHNGGWIEFGPEDGYLYISSGDGGPNENGQDNELLLGKILRIDVNNQGQGLNYTFPTDNPFIDSTGNIRKEIYATGLRNPWRCSFDEVTGLLWCADVGALTREEINIIVSGGNYGWSCYEGTFPYFPQNCLDPGNLIFPIYEYDHSEGASITGGHVYRGPNQPGLFGKYIYADWFSRKVWALEYDGVNPPINDLLFTLPSGQFINSFGVDEANELYICAGSRIYKIAPTAPITAPTNLTASSDFSPIVQLNWIDNSDNEEGFYIERLEGANNFEVIASVSANITSYEDTIPHTSDYQYRVKAYNIIDESGYSNPACISVKVVSVEDDFITLSDYNLFQNYPNPFNPVTNIRFVLPEESTVKIDIINILGEVIDNLVDAVKQSGSYTEIWNANKFSSGVYYVRMNAESLVSSKSFSQTIKIIFLK